MVRSRLLEFFFLGLIGLMVFFLSFFRSFMLLVEVEKTDRLPELARESITLSQSGSGLDLTWSASVLLLRSV